ncbi:MAG TPA: hypothetical protein VIZ58_12400, partial [Thermoanaerobaculia bacterium]
ERGLDAVARALRPGGQFWIYEADPEAPIGEIRRDQRPLWGWLKMPEWFIRKGLRGHGFTLAEVESALSPAVSRSAFGVCQAERTGSTLRIMMTRRP